MNWFEEFKKAYINTPSQDNEGYVPERGSYKAGFYVAWHLLEAENARYREALENIAEGRGYASGEEPWEVKFARDAIQLADFDAWAKDNPPKKTDLKALKKKLKGDE